MDIEELDSVDESVDRCYIFSDILYHKVNSKLKQLKVVLRRGIASDGSKVFNLDIRGIKHKYRFQLDFTPRELCFLRFEEFQDFVKDSSCWSCFDRNYYPSIVYSRILLVLYLDSGDGQEAKCIKVPFIQRGNVNSVTKLTKLQETIFHDIVSADELKHWQVHVVRCGDRVPGERVFLGLTKYAFVVVHNSTICHFHAFHNSTISIRCSSEQKEVEFTVLDKTLTDESQGTDNFSFHKLYTFKTNQSDQIERSFKELFQKSQLLPKVFPAAHCNILQSEQSASTQQGTTSDNVTIVPHKPLWNDNNNSGSGSVGNLTFDKISYLKESPLPNAHNSTWHTNFGFHSTSSNGSIPIDNSDIFFSHKDVFRYSDLPLNPRGTREKWPSDNDEVDDINDSLNLVEVEINEVETSKVMNTLVESPSPHQLQPDSAPTNNSKERLSSHKKKRSLPNMDDWFTFEFDKSKFVTEEEASDLPPPAPCPAFSQPFGEFPEKDMYLTNQNFQSVPMKPVVPVRVPKRMLRRSQSFHDLPDQEFLNHFYVNISQEMCSRGSVHDDSPYYRFYYNLGLIRSVFSRISQRKKIERVNRLSKELKEVDVNELDHHEQWYDRDFQERSRDPKFCSIYNIKPEPSSENDYSRVEEDDAYWTQNDLCITIQRLLEEDSKGLTLFTAVQRALDLTAGQLMEVQVLLSLVPAVNDWKNLAEFIGLTSGDISIIEHFCYTYRKLTTFVVLVHWFFKYQKNESIRPCNRENLLNFVNENNRRDIVMILMSRSENENIQNEDEIIASTHF